MRKEIGKELKNKYTESQGEMCGVQTEANGRAQ